MYLPRKIDSYLQEWKNDPHHKPLLVRGARQVGKSRAVRHLGESFPYFIEVNFEKRQNLKTLFEETPDVKDLSQKLGILFKQPVIPGKTLLFLDEIQSCAAAIKSLWFFKEDFPDLHVVAAGSLLEFALKDISSFGVGRVRSIFMYPLSFDEFLIAQGREDWVKAKKDASPKHPLFSALHTELVQQYRIFLMVGGMPASVLKWIETHDYQKCIYEQNDIQQTYYDDFAKYGSRINTQLLRNTLQSVITQIGSKFVYTRVEGEYRSAEVKNALELLCNAGIVKQVSHTSANGLPLGAQGNSNFQKYIYLDSGLLLRVLDMEFGGVKNLPEKILAGTTDDLVNNGGVAEMEVGLEMLKYSTPLLSPDLYYWENTDRGTSSEVDYVTSRNMNILPIEVKSGVSGKMKSLRFFLQKKGLSEAIRCSLENFAELTYSNGDDSVLTIGIYPLYAVSSFIHTSL